MLKLWNKNLWFINYFFFLNFLKENSCKRSLSLVLTCRERDCHSLHQGSPKQKNDLNVDVYGFHLVLLEADTSCYNWQIFWVIKVVIFVSVCLIFLNILSVIFRWEETFHWHQNADNNTRVSILERLSAWLCIPCEAKCGQ